MPGTPAPGPPQPAPPTPPRPRPRAARCPLPRWGSSPRAPLRPRDPAEPARPRPAGARAAPELHSARKLVSGARPDGEQERARDAPGAAQSAGSGRPGPREKPEASRGEGAGGRARGARGPGPASREPGSPIPSALLRPSPPRPAGKTLERRGRRGLRHRPRPPAPRALLPTWSRTGVCGLGLGAQPPTVPQGRRRPAGPALRPDVGGGGQVHNGAALVRPAFRRGVLGAPGRVGRRGGGRGLRAAGGRVRAGAGGGGAGRSGSRGGGPAGSI